MFAQIRERFLGTGILAALVTFFVATPATAQGSAVPSLDDQLGQQIVARAKAKGKRLTDDKTRKATIQGKKFELTPADLSAAKPADLKDGVFVGMLDTEASLTEDVSLLPGTYDLYVAQVNGVWTGYAERNGRLIKAKRAVERPDTSPTMEPTFNLGSGCWWLWLLVTGLNVCW